jgi:D-beta-D-heptose 7-phosphate kinase/D-beta-D-heptose 1-phosphate adenosyltransferase
MVITIIGEVCKDVFVYGESKRLCPEAPVPVFNPLYTETNGGMGLNVYNNIASIDPSITVNIIHPEQMIIKTRYVDEKSNHMFMRVDENECGIDPLFLYSNGYDEVIKNSDAVIISDYNKGFLTENTIFEINKISKFSIIDTKKILSAISVGNSTFLKFNESEFAKQNIDSVQMNKVLITLGSKGVKYLDKIYPSPSPKETIDVSGAGDTFTAAFTIQYLKTKSIEESIKFANEMASIVVSKRGVTVPYE